MKQSISLPYIEVGRAREFLIGSIIISIFCLALIVRERLGITNFFSVPIFRHLLIAHDYAGSLIAFAILAIAFLLRGTGPVLPVVRMLGRHPVIVAALAFVMFSAGSLLAYHNHPLSLDEYTPYLQSEAFAAGRLTGHFPLPLIEWLMPFPFRNNFLASSPATGDVATFYMPGFALLLAPFTFMGIPWACNPTLGALSLLTLHRLAVTLTDSKEAGGWAMLFALGSPAFSVNAMSYYSMTAHLLFNAGFTLLLLKPTVTRALIAGLVGGFALVLHNPFPHVVYAAPWIAWLLLRRDFRCLGALMMGYLPIALVLGAGWIWFTVGLQSTGRIQEAASAGTAVSGSAWTTWLSVVERTVRLPDASIVQARIAGAVKLWVWAVPGLPLLAWFGFLASKEDVRYRLLLASAVITLLGYFFIPFDQGHGWGYRYFHSAWGILPVLGAVAVIRNQDTEASGAVLVRIAGYAALGSLLFATALRVSQVDAFIDRHLSQVPRPVGDHAQVVFVNIRCGYYTVDLVQNHARLQRKVLMMVSHGPERNAEMAQRLSPAARQVAKEGCGELWLLE